MENKYDAKIPLNKVIPRKSDFYEKRLNVYLNIKEERHKPIFVVYAKDLDKYIIVDGHNRFLAHKKLRLSKINVIIKGIQPKTEFKGEFPLIDWRYYGK